MAVASAGPHTNHSRKITMPTPYRPDDLPDAQLCQSTEGCHLQCLIMATLCSRCRHYIFILWFLLSSFFLSSPNLRHRGFDVYHTWCGLSANLECRSEMRSARLAANTGRKKSPSRHHRTTLSGHIFAPKACIDNRKKIC